MRLNAKKLLALRSKSNAPISDIAGKLLVCRQTVRNWENEVSLPDCNQLAALSKIYNKPLHYFYNN
jgi:DNA-binding transcriptional regulator YiaG